jgi:hypothetical protein
MLVEADTVEIWGEKRVMQLYFSNDQSQQPQYVVLSRDLRPSDQDRRLGLDKLYLEVNDQGVSGYDAVQDILLLPGKVSILLEPSSQIAIECGHRIDITFDQACVEVQEIGTLIQFFVSK